jgi:hypothetical protein
MPPRAREIETLLLAMVAALPLYFTQAIGTIPLFVFHAYMAALMARVAFGKGPSLLPPAIMRALAALYVPFYFIDWLRISDSAVAASTITRSACSPRG